MRRAFGPRTAFEAAFLVAVPVVALAVGLGPYAIVGGGAVGYLLMLVLEARALEDGGQAAEAPKAARRRRRHGRRAPAPQPPAEPVVSRSEPAARAARA